MRLTVFFGVLFLGVFAVFNCSCKATLPAPNDAGDNQQFCQLQNCSDNNNPRDFAIFDDILSLLTYCQSWANTTNYPNCNQNASNPSLPVKYNLTVEPGSLGGTTHQYVCTQGQAQPCVLVNTPKPSVGGCGVGHSICCFSNGGSFTFGVTCGCCRD